MLCSLFSDMKQILEVNTYYLARESNPFDNIQYHNSSLLDITINFRRFDQSKPIFRGTYHGYKRARYIHSSQGSKSAPVDDQHRQSHKYKNQHHTVQETPKVQQDSNECGARGLLESLYYLAWLRTVMNPDCQNKVLARIKKTRGLTEFQAHYTVVRMRIRPGWGKRSLLLESPEEMSIRKQAGSKSVQLPDIMVFLSYLHRLNLVPLFVRANNLWKDTISRDVRSQGVTFISAPIASTIERVS